MPWAHAQLALDGTPMQPPPAPPDPESPGPPGGPVAGQLPLELAHQGPQLQLFHQRRRQRIRLQSGLRKHALNDRVRKCCDARVGPVVVLVVRDGKAYYRNVAQCGSVHACPVCRAKICAQRADEVTTVVEWHEDGRDLAAAIQALLEVGDSKDSKRDRSQLQHTYLLSSTIRHALGDSLEVMGSGLSEAFSMMIRGEPWKRFVERVGLVGYIRARDDTEGVNGWHPHLHTLLLVSNPLALEEAWEWLAERWQSCVARALGEAYVPDLFHGTHLKRANNAEYIAKLGLEVNDPGTKEGSSGGRTAWQIARDLVDHGRATDKARWSEWQEAMHGMRQLTWSRGLRSAAGLVEEAPSDDEIIEQDEQAEATPIYVITAEVWKVIRDPRSGDLRAQVLEAAELGGAEAVDACLRAAIRRRALAQDNEPPRAASGPLRLCAGGRGVAARN